jgi:signal transduction histidine kinase
MPPLGSFVDALPVATLVIDPDDHLVAVNAAARALLAIPARELESRRFRDLDLGDRIPGLRAGIERAKQGGSTARLPETGFDRGADPPRILDITVAPWRDERGRMAGVIVCVGDCTDLAGLRGDSERMESSLRSVTQDLDVTTAELQVTSEELQVARDDLQTANEKLCALDEELQATVVAREGEERRQDAFLATLAHELRNPLAPILSAMEIFRVRAATDPLLQHAREVVERQVRHQARLLDDLLDAARIATGKIALRRAVVDLGAVVRQALDATAGLVEARRHTVKMSLPAEPLRLDADASRLGQVVANLLDNAAKYTEPGGRISVTVAREEDKAVLRVRDSGIGIAPAMLERVFDLFAQDDSTLAHGHGGLGVGLALVRQLVAMHEGTVEACSEGPGRGAEFVVRLPIGPLPAEGEPAAAPRRRLSARRILVAEDNPDARAMLHAALTLDGHRVEVSAEGGRALERALADPPDVMLVDIGLPGLSGYEVARRVRARLGRAVVLIALTGYGRPEDRRRSHEAGFDAHLVKPVSVHEIDALVQELLGR